MRPWSRSVLAAASATVTAALAGTLLASPASARPAVELSPQSLQRGADIAVAHLDVDGHTVVDGPVRFTVDAAKVLLLGESGTSYVVGTSSARGGHGRIYRVTGDGARTLLVKAQPYMGLLSRDGATLVTTRVGRTAISKVSVYDVASGALRTQAAFPDYAVALDATATTVVLGSTRNTLLWTLPSTPAGSGSTRTVSHDPGYVADLAADLVGTFTKDPYDGGCSELRRVSTGALVWRSCTEQVAAFSTDASRIATIGILSDGPGPGRVDARTVTGQHLGRYQVRTGYFGSISFESPAGLLLQVYGARKTFTARCTGAACERATGFGQAEPLRAAS